MTPANPMQPFVRDEGPTKELPGLVAGTVRFKENRVVRWLLDHSCLNLNDLPYADLPQDDLCQFAQLIGYSLHGYHELSYVSDEHAQAASKAAREAFPDAPQPGGCRDDGCEIHSGVPKE